MSFDVVILGSGFSGALVACLLRRLGKSVLLVERHRHPRFAIGESSTPAADLILQELCSRYGLDAISPLARYGSWCRTYPAVRRGCKRGFSYFFHSVGRAFSSHDHRHELLVTANPDEERADTHWMRSDVDAFLCDQAIRLGAAYQDRTEVLEIRRGPHAWEIALRRKGETSIRTGTLIVDASGAAGVLGRHLELEQHDRPFRTVSCAAFGHAREIEAWKIQLRRSSVDTRDHPFDPDRSVIHHITPRFWVWEIPFDDGTTSLGIVAPAPLRQTVGACGGPTDSLRTAGADAKALWNGLLAPFPTLQDRMGAPRWCAPDAPPRVTRRLQRRWQRCADTDWVMLPHTAGFVDPLHSTGIAQSLAGIEWLMSRYFTVGRTARRRAALEYERRLRDEFRFLDALIAPCYAAMNDFGRFVALTMPYFAAATTYERRRLESGTPPAFLCADDAALVAAVGAATESVLRAPPAASPQELLQRAGKALAAYNHAGLCDPAAHNMYRFTAAEKPPAPASGPHLPHRPA